MTGELFNLLSTKSILASSVTVNELLPDTNSAFTKGVEEGASSNLLHSLFHVRTSQLFNYRTAQDNFHYLSGLLIGSELKDVVLKQFSNITLVSSPAFSGYYSNALRLLGCNNLRIINADEALVAGQCVIYNQLAGT